MRNTPTRRFRRTALAKPESITVYLPKHPWGPLEQLAGWLFVGGLILFTTSTILREIDA